MQSRDRSKVAFGLLAYQDEAVFKEFFQFMAKGVINNAGIDLDSSKNPFV